MVRCVHLALPLWWLGLPATLKGRVDPVFAVGRTYGGGRYFKRAICSVTVSVTADTYSSVGVYGPLDAVTFPINHGILTFVGFAVVQPFVVHAPARMSAAERAACLADYRSRVLSLETAPVFPRL